MKKFLHILMGMFFGGLISVMVFIFGMAAIQSLFDSKAIEKSSIKQKLCQSKGLTLKTSVYEIKKQKITVYCE